MSDLLWGIAASVCRGVALWFSRGVPGAAVARVPAPVSEGRTWALQLNTVKVTFNVLYNKTGFSILIY